MEINVLECRASEARVPSFKQPCILRISPTYAAADMLLLIQFKMLLNSEFNFENGHL